MPYWILELLILVVALSVDAFAASFVYGADRVKIPVSSVLLIAGISSGILFLSLGLGDRVEDWMPEGAVRHASFFLLFLLAVIKLFDSSVKSLIRRMGTIHKKMDKRLKVSVFNLHLILSVYADVEKANPDDSVLTPAEALSLGTALSLDSGLAGIGAGLVSGHLWTAVLFSMAANITAVAAGSRLGRLTARKINLNLSWISGLLLLLLAVGKLF